MTRRKPPPAVAHSLRLLRSLKKEALRAVASPDVAAVHDLRVAIRRLLAALELFEPDLPAGSDKIGRKAKKLLEPAGAVRDCDVALKLIAKLEVKEGAPVAPLAALLAAIDARRQASTPVLVAALTKRIERGTLDKWKTRLTAEPPPARAAQQEEPRIMEKMEQEFMKRGRAAAQPDATGEQLHRFRIAAKRLHYALELPVAAPASWMADAKAVQRLVGEIHDCEAVRAMIVDLADSAAVVDTLDQRHKKKMKKFQRLWKERFSTR
jgi:triphosphatase